MMKQREDFDACDAVQTVSIAMVLISLAVASCTDGSVGPDAGMARDPVGGIADASLFDSAVPDAMVDPGGMVSDAAPLAADAAPLAADAAPPAADAAPPVSDAAPPAADAAPSVSDAAAPVNFVSAHAIFAAKCGPCHTSGSSGGHSVGAADVNQAFLDSQLPSYTISDTKGAAALFRILDGSMPSEPVCSGDPVADGGNASCLTQEEQDTLQDWIEAGQPGPP